MIMARAHGINTKNIAESLKKKLDADPKRYYGIKLFYDHGDSSKPEVCQPTTYIGKRYGADATLSGVDIILTKDKNAFIAIEIEESQTRPKTILGDIFSVILSNKIRIKGEPYSVKNATVIIAISDTGKGKQSAKYSRLERHLNKYIKLNTSTSKNKIRIVSCETKDLVRRIERLIRLEAGKHQ